MDQQPKTVATVPVSVFIAANVLTALFTAAIFTCVTWLRGRSRARAKTCQVGRVESQRKWPLVIGSPHVLNSRSGGPELNRSFGSTKTLRADEERTEGKGADGSDWEQDERDLRGLGVKM
jgi:hypothetical protein